MFAGTSPSRIVSQQVAPLRSNLVGSERQSVQELNSIAANGLVSLYDAQRKRFASRAILTKDGFRKEGISQRRTIVALLGLKRLSESGANVPLDVAAASEHILSDSSWVKSLQDLGLLTWFTAVCKPQRLPSLFAEFDFGSALESYADGRRAQTRSLAWFLSGVTHAQIAGQETLPNLTDIAVETYRLLEDNQSEDGIFGHATHSHFPMRAFYNRFGTLADQTHAIYALSMFASAFQIEEPLGSALNCANAICALQGEMGQWWFLYDKRKCSVVNRYPVCSVHQDGTAPAGLLALEEASGQKFLRQISKGLSWIAGANEIGVDLRSADRALIWDSIGRGARMSKYWEGVLNLLNVTRQGPEGDLSVQYEARPDHFGWPLYAFGRFGLPKSSIADSGAAPR